ncbi:MAG: transcriptional regulator NrdR [Phycisphaerales bacterium]|nr:transcriptional regulator NrdR [Phycisphaerales bacterium]
MRCPYCKEQKDKVIDSRATEGGAVIRRRRQCLACNRRYTTYERIETTSKLLVVKKDGNRDPYAREKLLGGVQRACWKRPLGMEILEDLVDEVEEEVFKKFDREVPSSYLGQAVSVRLRRLDKVAYLRYASLYHEFQLVDDFIQEAQDILERDQQEITGQQDLFQQED